MFFKSLLLSGLVLTTPLNSGEVVEPNEPPIVEVIEEKYFINTSTLDGGTATYEVRRDNAIVEKGLQKGDVVYFSIKEDMFYDLNKTTVNVRVGESTYLPTYLEDTNQWYFTLEEEGTYIIKANFTINNETFENFLNIYNSIKNQNWEYLFSPQTIMFLFTTFSFFIYMLVKIVGDRKFKNEVVSKVSNSICETFGLTKDSTPEQAMTAIAQNIVIPLVEKIKKGQEMDREAIVALTKAVLYMQENTPEAREKIVSMIGKIENLDTTVNEVTNIVMAKLKEEKDTKVKEQEEINKTFDDLKENIKKTNVEEQVTRRPLD